MAIDVNDAPFISHVLEGQPVHIGEQYYKDVNAGLLGSPIWLDPKIDNSRSTMQ